MAGVNVVERIKKALESVNDASFSKVIEQRAKTIINVNSSDPSKARKILASPEFARAIRAEVSAMRKTAATGFSVFVNDPRYGKPVFMRIRKGGLLAPGIKNEHGLLGNIESAIQGGVQSIVFMDSVKGSITIQNPVSVRSTGNDAGSRMGNRADIEIMDGNGIAHRISVKKDNATKVAGLTRFLAKRRLKIQKALRDFIQTNQIQLIKSGLVSVQILNSKLFNFCWFGNDIDKNGGVVIGNFDGTDCFVNDGVTLKIKCLRAFSLNDNFNKLVDGDLTSIYLIMHVNARTFHMDFYGAYNRKMGGRYELEGFEIDDITNESSITVVDEDWEDF